MLGKNAKPPTSGFGLYNSPNNLIPWQIGHKFEQVPDIFNVTDLRNAS